MKKCPYCGEASVWHTQTSCFRTRLERSEARMSRRDEALREFRHQLHHDPHISEDLRLTVIGHLDSALIENQLNEAIIDEVEQ